MTTNDNARPADGRPAPNPPAMTRAEAEALIPWLVTGRAAPDEIERVEAAARRWPEIAASLARARIERDAARLSAESLGAPSAGAFDRLIASAKAAPTHAPAPRRVLAAGPNDLLDRIAGWLHSLAPRRLGALGAAVAALLVIATGVIGYQAERLAHPPTYTTASGPGAGTAVKGAPEALVTFRSDATAAEIARLLSGLGAEIVAGPQAGATYRVRLAPKGGETGEAALARLKASDIAAFAVLAK